MRKIAIVTIASTAPVAQWIERPPPKGKVAGSIPAGGANEYEGLLND